jgi:predicted CDP-diglyceride synthetase/phosphatidate cytidylyltransferase
MDCVPDGSRAIRARVPFVLFRVRGLHSAVLLDRLSRGCLARRADGGFLRAAASLYLGVVLTVFSTSHIALLLMLPDAPNPAGGGVGLVVFLLLVTQLNDVAQYVSGKCFGRRSIAPRLSPRKTVEGLAGGILVSGLTATWSARC